MPFHLREGIMFFKNTYEVGVMLSKKAQSIKEYVAGEQIDDGYIKLNSNESPYAPPEAVLKAALSVDLNKYPNTRADILRKKLSDMHKMVPGNIFVGNGSDEVLAFAFQAFFNPDGGEVVAPDITYSFYPVWAQLYDIPYRTIPVNDDMTIDIGPFLSLTNCQGIILANPNAPTGIELDIEWIDRIARQNPDKIIIIDEAYADFGMMNSADTLTKIYPNLIVIRTFSKSWGLAAARCGYAMGAENLIKGLEKIRNCFNSYSVNSMTQKIISCAIDNRDYVRENSLLVVRTRERVSRQLKEWGFYVTPSSTNFIFITKENWSAKKAYETLKERKILVRYFDLPRIDNYLRVTIGTDKDMDVFLNEIKKTLK